MSSFIAIDPRMKFGAPAIQGSRIDPDVVVGLLLAYDYGEVITSYPHLKRDDVLVSCWYVARYARPKDWSAKDRRRLRDWLEGHEEAMWANEDWSEVPTP